MGLDVTGTLYDAVTGGDAQLFALKTTDDFTQEGGRLAVSSKGIDRIPFYSALNNFDTDENFTFTALTNTLNVQNVNLSGSDIYSGSYACPIAFMKSYNIAGSGLTQTNLGEPDTVLQSSSWSVNVDNVTTGVNLTTGKLEVKRGNGLMSSEIDSALEVDLTPLHGLEFADTGSLQVSDTYARSLISAEAPDLVYTAATGIISSALEATTPIIKTGNVLSFDMATVTEAIEAAQAETLTAAEASSAAEVATAVAAVETELAGVEGEVAGLSGAMAGVDAAILALEVAGFLFGHGGGGDTTNNTYNQITYNTTTASGQTQIVFAGTDSSLSRGIVCPNDFHVWTPNTISAPVLTSPNVRQHSHLRYTRGDNQRHTAHLKFSIESEHMLSDRFGSISFCKQSEPDKHVHISTAWLSDTIWDVHLQNDFCRSCIAKHKSIERVIQSDKFFCAINNLDNLTASRHGKYALPMDIPVDFIWFFSLSLFY